jgi:hypothetical protein
MHPAQVLGVMLCTREAIRLMRAQTGGGHIFNMDGAGGMGWRGRGLEEGFASHGVKA